MPLFECLMYLRGWLQMTQISRSQFYNTPSFSKSSLTDSNSIGNSRQKTACINGKIIKITEIHIWINIEIFAIYSKYFCCWTFEEENVDFTGGIFGEGVRVLRVAVFSLFLRKIFPTSDPCLKRSSWYFKYSKNLQLLLN